MSLGPWLTFACAAEQTVEPTVDAKPGIRQVGSADGPLLDEDAACAELREALVDATSRLDCDDVAVQECPELIRPAGSLACLRFSEESVDACVGAIEGHGSCSDFTREACVVVAVTSERTEGCVPPGAADGGPDEPGDDDAADDDVADDDVADDDAADDDVSGNGGAGGVGDSGAGGSGPGLGDGGTEGPADASAPPDSGVSPEGGAAADSGPTQAEDAGADLPLEEAGVAGDAGL